MAFPDPYFGEKRTLEILIWHGTNDDFVVSNAEWTVQARDDPTDEPVTAETATINAADAANVRVSYQDTLNVAGGYTEHPDGIPYTVILEYDITISNQTDRLQFQDNFLLRSSRIN